MNDIFLSTPDWIDNGLMLIIGIVMVTAGCVVAVICYLVVEKLVMKAWEITLRDISRLRETI